jgi:sugar phosphate isomerase/epimerase
MRLAAQMYTVRQYLQSRADALAAIRRVKEIGYDVVQMSAHGLVATELAEMLEGEGLECCAIHEKMERLQDHTDRVIEALKLLNCNYVALGGFFPQTAEVDDWKTFAKTFNDIAGRFEGSGIHLGYHNHSHELVRYGGKTALEILIEEFVPQVWIEIDTYWIQHGGGDPAAWINKVAGRIPIVHLKDMAITLDRQPLFAEVGEGNLNWPAILSACDSAGVKWGAVEQDTCQRDPFESLEISLKNLRAMGA